MAKLTRDRKLKYAIKVRTDKHMKRYSIEMKKKSLQPISKMDALLQALPLNMVYQQHLSITGFVIAAKNAKQHQEQSVSLN